MMLAYCDNCKAMRKGRWKGKSDVLSELDRTAGCCERPMYLFYAFSDNPDTRLQTEDELIEELAKKNPELITPDGKPR